MRCGACYLLVLAPEQLWNSSTGKWDLPSVVSKWCNHQRQIRSADLTALTRNATPRTFNSPVVHEECLYFLAAETIHAQFREQLGGIDSLSTHPDLNVHQTVFSFMQIGTGGGQLKAFASLSLSQVRVEPPSLSPGAEQWLLQAGGCTASHSSATPSSTGHNLVGRFSCRADHHSFQTATW